MLDRSLDAIPAGERAVLIAGSVARRYGRALNPFRAKPAPLTDTYLRDPELRARLEGSAPARLR